MTITEPVLVLIGTPGSGKSTLLRRLKLDENIDRLRDDGKGISLFMPLNGYRARAGCRSREGGECGGSASATEAVRRAIQSRQASLRSLAWNYDINSKIGAK